MDKGRARPLRRRTTPRAAVFSSYASSFRRRSVHSPQRLRYLRSSHHEVGHTVEVCGHQHWCPAPHDYGYTPPVVGSNSSKPNFPSGSLFWLPQPAMAGCGSSASFCSPIFLFLCRSHPSQIAPRGTCPLPSCFLFLHSPHLSQIAPRGTRSSPPPSLLLLALVPCWCRGGGSPTLLPAGSGIVFGTSWPEPACRLSRAKDL